MNKIHLQLTSEQRAELEAARDHHERAYVRERAAAILKIEAGQDLQDVAEGGLLRRRHRTTVSIWVHRYLAEGMAGLLIRPGRGRKASFFPSRGRRGQRPNELVGSGAA